ncbi:MAG: hypothetical protein GYA41_00125 [Bacteroidales bacterium]|nr:hypothetical protein [Bacteroidales bacterium]
MKNEGKTMIKMLINSILIFSSMTSCCQNEKALIGKYMQILPTVIAGNELHKYRMNAVYLNRDLYGNFTGKTKVTGEYTRGLKNDSVRWNNVFISASDNLNEDFGTGAKQEYMENFRYSPAKDMLKPDSFKDFPAGPETVLAKNLVWDMGAIESFAWEHIKDLKMNTDYTIPQSNEEFNMGGIGTYAHNNIHLCWTGICSFNDELCGVIEFRAVDNKIEMSVEPIKTKGTEQYWGTIRISLETGLIEQAEMYGGTIQEIEITGMENKMIAKTIRELWLDKIQ